MLLVTQFQYQDPLNPMEDKEFVAQLAQFSALEQNITMNENLSTLISIQQQAAVVGSAAYIGKEVSARGYGVSVSNSGEKISLVQFASDEDMASCYVSILDTSTKTVLNTYDLGRLSAGTIHDFQWDGMMSGGGKAADGVYTVSIVGKNAKGDTVMVDTSVTGRVNGVSYYNGEQYLRLDDGRTVLLSNVREVLDTTGKSNMPPGMDPDASDGNGNSSTVDTEIGE